MSTRAEVPRRAAVVDIAAMRIAAAAALLALASCATARPSQVPEPGPVGDAVASSDLVFFGEEHDDRAQHEYEAWLLATLYDADAGRHPLLLGMEMFQRPFQQPLDDYVAGRIDEREMLRRTEYFTRWSFDYTFYAPLWRFCREHGIRVVALNADQAISRKTGREGISALTGDERSQVAADIDLNVPKHRERIVEMFTGGAHKVPEDRLQKLYEAMTLWDETMAESAANALAAAGPGARMLVVAGSGHIKSGTGIPDRLARRVPGLRRTIVVADYPEEGAPSAVTRDADQFVVPFVRHEPPPAPKLGVAFDAAPAPAGMLVQSVTDGGTASLAGVKPGDVLAHLGGAPVSDMTDVRYVVDASRTGWRVHGEVIRDGARVPVEFVMAPPPPAPEPAAPKP
jgi:uncharacterized iron-regulated protein